MDIAASRRDLLGAIAPAGSERDGLAPPSKIAEGLGRISTRKPRDFSPMSSAPTFTTKQRGDSDAVIIKASRNMAMR
jgi:hypothetical protein